MCGIAGIVNFNNEDNKNVVDKMLTSINFRGPDFKTSISGNFFDVGMVRLSIIDLTTNGNQPFISEDGNIITIYNGEIYNFEEIKKNFFPNFPFLSTCDGEIIPLMYKKFGLDFINYLKGMFAICVIDKSKKEVVLIRDRFGIKPLYYYIDNTKKTLIFGSEIQSLFESKKIKKLENFYETSRYLNMGLVSATNETWFKNVFQVEPGEILIFSKNDCKFKKYYKLEENIDESSDKKKLNYFKLEKDIFSSIEKSIKEHSVSDQTIGIHISGGNDSACLAAGCKKTGLKTQCFTFDFEEKEFSEKTDALNISSQLGYKHFIAKIKNSDLISEFEKVVQIQFEPFSSLRIVSQNYLYEKFKNSCKVIFDGCGGDEIGAGYNYHQVAWMLDMIEDGYRNPEKKIFKFLSKYETISKKEIIEGSLKKLSDQHNVHEDGSIFENSEILDRNNLKNFKNKYKFKKPFKSKLRNAQYKDLIYTKIPRTLRYADRASMRYSIETRLPLLDHELVEKMFSMPTKYKYIAGYQRFVLKRFSKELLDKSLIFKNKRPIADPQSYWLKTIFKDYILDTLNSRYAKEDDIIDAKKLEKSFKKLFNSKKHFNSFFLFQCLNYFVWKNKILKGS